MIILIAEDDGSLRRALQTKFSQAGIECVAVSNGQEAIAALREQNFTAVVLDILMPNTDGFAVLEAIKSTPNSNIPVYVITNLGAEAHCDRATAMGARQCFVKSDISLKEVVQTVLGDVS